MNRWGTILLSIFTVLVVGGIAVTAYSIGFDNGVAADANIEVVRADGATDVVGPRWGYGGWFPFGFIFPLFFLFLILFLVSRAFWWRPWRHGGYGPGGPGPQGWWGVEKHLEDWHRHAHGNHPPSDPTGTGA